MLSSLLKKYIGLSIVVFFCCSVYAERLEYVPPAITPPPKASLYQSMAHKKIYIHGFFGLATDGLQNDADASVDFTDNGDSLYTFGIDAGLPLLRALSVEGGYYYFPKATYLENDLTQSVSQWYSYAAAKIHYTMPSNHLDFYLKTGAGLRDTKYGDQRSYKLRPMVATGIDYPIVSQLSLSLQYLFFTSVDNDGAGHFIPAMNTFVAGLGYAFATS